MGYKIKRSMLHVGLLFAIFPLHAHAYLDPGTGSMIIQSVIAIFVALLVYFRQLKHAVKSFIEKFKRDN